MTTLPSRDLIETLVATTPVEAKHAGLLKALRERAGMDTVRFATVRDGYSRTEQQNLIVTPEGESLGPVFDWMKAELTACGSPAAVLDKHQNSPLLRTISEISRLHFVAPIGDGPSDFIQIDVELEQMFVADELFSKPWSPPGTLDNLVSWCKGSPVPRMPFGQAKYTLNNVWNIPDLLSIEDTEDRWHKKRYEQLHLVIGGAPFYERHPGLRTLAPKCRRLFNDWENSSAGRSGAAFADHWIFTSIHVDQSKPNSTHISMIPGWTTAKPPAEIKYKAKETCYGLWDRLLKIDKRAGYPFAWFFYMLHGNRVHDGSGKRILDAAEAGQIVMPEHDYQILKQWREHPYGF